MGSASPKHTCLKLEMPHKERIFVKGSWFSSHFDLFVTDGFEAWTCLASEEKVEERASQWDQPVSEYIDLGEKYLGFQQPGSVYGFDDAGSGHKREDMLQDSTEKKLRELRDKLSKQGTAVQEPVDDEETQSTDRTETFADEKSGEEAEKDDVGTSSNKDDVTTTTTIQYNPN